MANMSRMWMDGVTRTLDGTGWAFQLALIALLVPLSFHNYLLFHTLAEGFTIVVAVLMCVITWTTYPFSRNTFFMYLACGYFWIGALDLMHALAYKGMVILPFESANPATQFWIATRFLEALLLASAPAFFDRRVYRIPAFLVFAAFALTVMALVLSRNFPDAFIEGEGLTAFKVAGEYVVIAILAVALAFLAQQRHRLAPEVFLPLALAIFFTMAAELAFTFYVSVYGLSDLVGHVFKLLSFSLIFTAVIRTSLENPYRSLQDEVGRRRRMEEELEQRVESRTRHLEREIEARKDAELAAKESAATTRAVIEAALDCIITMDHEGKVLEFNPAAERTFGYSRNEAIGQELAALIVPPNLRNRHREGLQRYLDTGKAVALNQHLELVAMRKDGTEFPVELAITVIDWNGAQPRFSGYLRDITLRKDAEEALKRSNEELEQFAYVASHDLQEPLRTITTYNQLLSRRYHDRLDANANEFIDFVVNASHRMQALIRDLLEYSRIQTRGQTPEPNPLAPLVDGALDNLRTRIEDAGAKIDVGTLPRVKVDATQILRMFQNLIGNAIKYRHPERAPEIEIRAERREDAWQFSVRDNGIGIEESQFERVFMIFQRLHTAEEYEGTGIGLAVCKKIIERHGGRIWMESTPGAGCTVFFTLPGT